MPSPSQISRYALLSLLPLTLPLSAQNGDRQGEKQAPLPAHIVVPPAPVLSPEEELATFKLAPGFRAELVAADPLLGDPVAVQFGPDGRLWVVEMHGYMLDIDGNREREPIGSIAVLEDTNADGRYDKRTVFADKLVMPRALSLVDNGILIAEPKTLWFMRDTNRDGIADEKTAVATDYGNIENPEHNANGLLWAMDNWIYSANYTARFRYDGGGRFQREATITRGQWGITQDDIGRLYYNGNSDPLRVDAVPSAYLRRNPNFTGAGANLQLVPGNLRVWPGRVTAGVNRGYQILDQEGKIRAVTAAGGPVIYRGSLFPAEFQGDAFIAEPSANLIKRIKLTDRNGTYRGANAYDGSEFLTSTDERFRPVNLFNGPDGALYVVDFYRGLIQHRIYLTSFLRQQAEERGLDKGLSHGRIWRIVPDGAPKANFQLTYPKASTAELVTHLENPNGWVRDTAQRLLVERRDPDADVPLRKLSAATAKPVLSRLQALWTLEGSGALERDIVIAALNDPDPRIVAAGIRLTEKFLRMPAGDDNLSTRLFALVDRTEPAIRLQLALTLGEVRTPAGDRALAALVVKAGRQEFLADAAVSGLTNREAAFIEMLSANPAAAENGADTIRLATSALLKSGDIPSIDRVLAPLAVDATPEWVRTALLAGVRQFMPRTPDGRSVAATLPAEPKALLALAAKKDAPGSTVAQQLVTQLRWTGKAGMETKVVRPLTADEQALFARGQAQFATLCAACHQPTGQGLPGIAPSLLNSRWVLGDSRILSRVVLNGKAQENLIMPPWKATLTDDAIAGVLTFIRRSWGHDADPVTAATVAESRAATATRELPFTEADLLKLQQDLR